MKTLEQGKKGEMLAEQHLRSLGFSISTKNFRSRMGEIDLVAERAGELYFCEVRWRGAGSLLEAAETVDWRKQEKIRKTAQCYLRLHEKNWKGEEPPCHFSVLALDQRAGELQVEWWEDAF